MSTIACFLLFNPKTYFSLIKFNFILNKSKSFVNTGAIIISNWLKIDNFEQS